MSAPAVGAEVPVSRPWLHRLWPASLKGRVVVIMIAGMLAAQSLTGTIWWDLRKGQLLEVPLRVAAARAGDSLQLLASLPPEARESAAQSLGSSNYHFHLLDEASARALPVVDADEPSARLVVDVMSKRAGTPVPVRLVRADLLGDDGHSESAYALLTAVEPVTDISLVVPLPDGKWLRVDAKEGESGYPVRPLDALADYVVRIYVLRIVVVALVALGAVWIAMRPLAKLAAAAQALGRDLDSPPMATDGPTELRQAARAFNAMQQQIVDGVAQRTRFLAAVSHDLRTPITRLRLRAEMLQPPSMREVVREDLAEMEAMVDGTLDMLRGTEGLGPRQRVDMNSMLQGLAQDMEDTHGVTVPVQACADSVIEGYSLSLRRCFANLLENARRYAKEPRVLLEDDGQQLTVTVRDSGPGIPEEHLAQVTEPYYRLDPARTPTTGGVGLGLSIVDTVVRAHGGSLQLVNRAEGGLDAVIRLPRR